MALDCSSGKQIFFKPGGRIFSKFSAYIYISDPALCWLFIYLFIYLFFFFFLVIQINLKHFDGWSIQ